MTMYQHGPWSHPHTAMIAAEAPQLIVDLYAHDREQREAASEFFKLAIPERFARGLGLAGFAR